jgi:hypothetical protein
MESLASCAGSTPNRQHKTNNVESAEWLNISTTGFSVVGRLGLRSAHYGIVTALHVVPEQTYRVVLAVPSVLNHTDPLPVGGVPHVEVGAPAPTEIDAPLTEVPIP